MFEVWKLFHVIKFNNMKAWALVFGLILYIKESIRKLNLFIMKTIFVALVALVGTCIWSGCRPQDRYLDLSTGEKVDLERDSVTGLMVRTDTKEPVQIYVDTETNDTIYGPTGKVINGYVVKLSDGKYKYDDGEYKIKDDEADYKKKVEKDGDVKIKDGDSKTKIDGETGERKTKTDG